MTSTKIQINTKSQNSKYKQIQPIKPTQQTNKKHEHEHRTSNQEIASLQRFKNNKLPFLSQRRGGRREKAKYIWLRNHQNQPNQFNQPHQ
jgi:hypothetical protein